MWLNGVSELWAAATSPEGLRHLVEGYGMLAPLAFFLAEAAQVVFSPLPGGLLPPVGALAFGPWAALALSLGGCAAGSVVVFALARRCGRPLVQRLVKAETIDRYAGVLSARGGLWLFLVVAVPVFPGDAVCAIAGLSSISFARFIALSTLARVPSTALGIFVATELTELTELSATPGWLWLVMLLVLGAVVAAIAQRSRVEAWLLRPNV
jgi:uncharacterized membrane protein YdjX (TVP38/TMEM64 family)